MEPTGLRGDEGRVGEQPHPSGGRGAQFGGATQPIDRDGRATPADRLSRRLIEEIGDLLVRTRGRRRQVGGAANHGILVQPGEVRVRVAAVVSAGLMNDRRPHEWMPEDDVATGVHRQQVRIDGLLHVRHHIPGTDVIGAVGFRTVQGRPQQFGAHPGGPSGSAGRRTPSPADP